MLRLDQDKCTGCGLCTVHCTENVIQRSPEGRPVLGDVSHCLECHHCEAVCPAGAISNNGDSAQVAVEPQDINHRSMERFLATKRSCRHFKDQMVEITELERLVNVARMAPSSKRVVKMSSQRLEDAAL